MTCPTGINKEPREPRRDTCLAAMPRSDRSRGYAAVPLCDRGRHAGAAAMPDPRWQCAQCCNARIANTARFREAVLRGRSCGTGFWLLANRRALWRPEALLECLRRLASGWVFVEPYGPFVVFAVWIRGVWPDKRAALNPETNNFLTHTPVSVKRCLVFHKCSLPGPGRPHGTAYTKRNLHPCKDCASVPECRFGNCGVRAEM